MKRDTRAGSLPYAEAGERMRLSQARLVEARANLRAWRVAAAVWGLTAGYSKAWDAVFVDGLAALTGMDERSVRRGIKECERARALQWRASFKVGEPSLVGLPNPGPSKPGVMGPRAVEARAVAARLPSNEALSVELSTHDSAPGTHHSSLIGASDRSEGSRDWHAEKRAIPEGQTGPAYDWDAYDAEMEAAWRASQPGPATTEAECLARFGEAEPAAVTDTDVQLLRRRRR